MNPAAYNPRKDLSDNDVEYQHIKNSLETFGLLEPIVWNERTGNIIAGHQRVNILKAQGVKQVECSVVDFDTEKEKACNIAMNKVSGVWDEDKLDALLFELQDSEIDMTAFGFDLSEFDKFIEPAEDDYDVDTALEELAPVVKRGQLWKLGDHYLLCGDATNISDVNMLLDNSKVDLVVTDPPYNMNYSGSGGTSASARDSNKILNDNMSDDKFDMFLHSVFTNLGAVMNTGASCYVFYKELGTGAFIEAMRRSDIEFRQELVWVKNQLVLGGSKYQNMYEPCLFGSLGKVKTWNGKRTQRSVIESVDLMNELELREAIKDLLDSETSDVIRERKPTKNDLHPTMKPIKLLAKLIKNSSDKGDVVLDVFGGSGSTLIACEQLGRRCYMSELDERYCDVIIARYEEHTGKQAELIRA